MDGTTPGEGGQAPAPPLLAAGNSWATVMRKKNRQLKGAFSANIATAARNSASGGKTDSKQGAQAGRIPPTSTPSSSKPTTKVPKKVALPTGKKEFKTLQSQLGTGAATHAILDVMTQLRQKACNRRFAAFQARQSPQSTGGTELTKLREYWNQLYRILRSHSEYNRVWNLSSPEEISALTDTLEAWIVRKKATQYEVEQRLMAFELVMVAMESKRDDGKPSATTNTANWTTYRDAVNGESSPRLAVNPVEELSSDMKNFGIQF